MDDGKMEIDLFGECLPRGVFADSELWGDIWRGWIVPVGGSTPDRHRWGGSSTDRHRHRWGGSSTDWQRHQGGGAGAFFRIRNCGGYLAGVERSGRSLSRSGVEPPTGTIHPRKSRGIEDGKWVEGFIAGYAFPNLKVRDIFGGGGAFRSGV